MSADYATHLALSSYTSVRWYFHLLIFREAHEEEVLPKEEACLASELQPYPCHYAVSTTP